MRPARCDILDNFGHPSLGSAESADFVAALWEQMRADSKQAVKLTARRSRLRPLPKVMSGLAAVAWSVGRWYNIDGIEILGDADEAAFAEFGWLSPARRGRLEGKQKKRMQPFEFGAVFKMPYCDFNARLFDQDAADARRLTAAINARTPPSLRAVMNVDGAPRTVTLTASDAAARTFTINTTTVYRTSKPVSLAKLVRQARGAKPSRVPTGLLKAPWDNPR